MTIQSTLTLTPEMIQAVGAERRRGRPKRGEGPGSEVKATGYRLSLDAIEGIARAAEAFGVSENSLIEYLGRSLKAQALGAQ